MTDGFQNLFNKEPEFKCPICNAELHTDWVDNGFGAYSVQVSPYVCQYCDWSEKGCTVCIYEKCFSWERCEGRALIDHDKEKETTTKSIDTEHGRDETAGTE